MINNHEATFKLLKRLECTVSLCELHVYSANVYISVKWEFSKTAENIKRKKALPIKYWEICTHTHAHTHTEKHSYTHVCITSLQNKVKVAAADNYHMSSRSLRSKYNNLVTFRRYTGSFGLWSLCLALHERENKITNK